MNSTRSQSISNLHNIVNLDKDTREVSINGSKYAAGGEKPTGFFSSLTMAFRCFFRSDDEVSKNNSVFKQVKQDIHNTFGEDTAIQFNDEMQSKIDMGSPLTKGALMRFLNQNNLVIPSEAAPTAAATTTSSNENTAKLKTKIETQLIATIALVSQQNPGLDESALTDKIIGTSSEAQKLRKENPEMSNFLTVIEKETSGSADTLLQELFKGAKTTQSEKSTLAATNKLTTVLNKAFEQLEQRGKTLSRVVDQSEKLKEGANIFQANARQLKNQLKGRCF
ncbi:MAG: hypothetical protein DVB29_07120 [Verrucomicrobia bacterium]|nr:MAG: hypothetical protein DVB29_07120 [Verrucomicrobiota bacterium]